MAAFAAWLNGGTLDKAAARAYKDRRSAPPPESTGP